jgi:hypothetical protein
MFGLIRVKRVEQLIETELATMLPRAGQLPAPPPSRTVYESGEETPESKIRKAIWRGIYGVK